MSRVIALCSDYNGHKDTLFQMEASDDRLGNGNYAEIAKITKRAKGGKVTADNGKTYQIFPDWSAKEIRA